MNPKTFWCRSLEHSRSNEAEMMFYPTAARAAEDFVKHRLFEGLVDEPHEQRLGSTRVFVRNEDGIEVPIDVKWRIEIKIACHGALAAQ